MNLSSIQIKKKDVVYIAISAVVLIGVVVLGYRQLKPASGTGGVTVEVVQPIGANLNRDALDHLRDETKSKDFNIYIDLTAGVGNSTPFGQL